MFTTKELKLIEEALLAYAIEEEETQIYSKIDKLIKKNEKNRKLRKKLIER
ncbi:MAG: hypothetical protein ACK52I_07645 [Pseudomonadota bacterium]|jgi:hypothetical protein